MVIKGKQGVRQTSGQMRGSAADRISRLFVVAAALCFLLGAVTACSSGSSGNLFATAGTGGGGGTGGTGGSGGAGGASANRFCTDTAEALFEACGFEVADDFANAEAICINEEDEAACLAEATAEQTAGRQLCTAQRDGRLNNCRSIGEGRYDPQFNPADFDTNFASLSNPNPYFPLKIGNRWDYAGGSETNTVEVLNETKRITGLTCIVVQDQVFDDGELIEDTDDWYCQAKNGDVYYLGEEVKDFESFDGDDPQEPELVSTDGSFKHGRDGDKGGLFFFANPTRGAFNVEEFSLGNAEDVTEILSTTYGFGSEPELDQSVPKALADRFCLANNCVVTKNFSLLEPGVFARKYYAPGIGVFLEVETGSTTQLVDCNFDARCVGLPAP